MTTSFNMSTVSQPARLDAGSPYGKPVRPPARQVSSATGSALERQSAPIFCVGNRDFESYSELAKQAMRAGNYLRAEAMWLAALGEAKNFNFRDERLGKTLDSIASLYCEMRRYAQAELFWKKAVEVATEAYGGYDRRVAACLNNLAGLYYKQRRFADAEPICLRLIGIYEHIHGSEHDNLGMALNNLAMLYHAQGKLYAAEKFYQRALAIRSKTLGHRHPNVVVLIDNYARLLRRLNKFNQAGKVGRMAMLGSLC